MNVLVVCQYYYPEPFRLTDICEAMVEAGHAVTVVTGTPNYPEGEIYPGYEKGAKRDEIIRGVRVHRCPLVPRKKGVFFRFLNYYSYAASSWWYLRRCREDFDVVFVNQLSPVMMAQAGLSWAKRHGKRCVLYCLDLWPESLTAGGIQKGSLIYRVFTHISRKIYRSADHILVTSKGFAPYLNETLKVGKDCEFLPQYAEAMFDDVPPREAHQPPYHFVFAGNIGELQSVETIIEAARILKDDPRAVFDIVGDGSAFSRCKELAEGLPNVVFHGRRDIQEMPRFYALADGMIVSLIDNPAIARTLPGKVQSYMAAGRAIVGSIGGETEAVITDARCGVCAPPEDSAQLAERIRMLLENPDQLCAYGRNAREYYRRYFRKSAFMERLIAALERNSTIGHL